MSILLVDTTEPDAALLASALRVEGVEVLVARSAQDARAALASHHVDLAIVDLMLRTERTNGLDLARELRREHPAMRIFLTSSYHLSERQLERADCGVSGFIPKPYDLAEVTAFLRVKLSGPPSSRRMWSSEPRSGVSPALPADAERPSDDDIASRR